MFEYSSNIIQFLYDKGYRDYSIISHFAAMFQKQNIIEELEKDNKLDVENAAYGAAEGGHLEYLYEMVKRGFNKWRSIAYYATQGGHLNLVNIVLDNYINDQRLIDSIARTASMDEHFDIVKAMVQRGVTPNNITLHDIVYQCYTRGGKDVADWIINNTNMTYKDVINRAYDTESPYTEKLIEYGKTGEFNLFL